MMWNFNKYSNKIAIIDDRNNQISYKELDEIGLNLANVVGKRCLVFSMCTNQLESVVGYSAFINHNIVPVLLNAGLEFELLNNLIEKYNPSYIWLPKEQCGLFPNMKVVYTYNEYCLIKTGFSQEYELHKELGLLLTTSGSTGSPKFVRQSYRNIEANAQSIVSYLHLDETERPISTLPMNYTYGLSIINSHFMVGATLLMTEYTLMQKEFWNFFKQAEATSFGGVPYTYEMLDKLRFFTMKLPSLRYMTQAGGKLSPELHKKFAEYSRKADMKFIVMYGQCEATARMGYLPAEYSLEKYGSMGIAIPNGEFSLIDSEGNVIEEAEVTGELVYTGPNVTMGYAECGEDLVKGDERQGKLYTGDMAKRDADGFYYIVGRKKRFLKIYGNRVNLDEVDRLVKEKFNYIDCASTGVDDHLYVFVTDETLVSEVRKFIVEKTGFNHVAIKVVKIDEIPKNDAGKVLYRELAAFCN